MAANLAVSGRRVAAYVRRPDQMGSLIGLGLRPTLEFVSLFDCGIVISMLPDDAAVRDVVLGRDGAGSRIGTGDGAIHLSMSTIGTATASQVRGGAWALRARLRRCACVWKSGCRQDPPTIHCGRRRCGRCRALSTAVRQHRTKDICRGNRSYAGKPRQAAWQHDDCHDPGDAGRSRGCSSQARTRSEGFRRHHDEHNVRRTRT